MNTDAPTFAQIRAALQCAAEVLAGDIAQSEIPARLPQCCEAQGAAYVVDLDDLAALFVVFGRKAAGRG